jgi:cyclic beta-1,2-glucan synthetase
MDPWVRQQGAILLIDPCIPKTWPAFGIAFRYKFAGYDIRVENPDGVCRRVAHAELDGVTLPGSPARIPLADDGGTHHVRVVLG